MSLLNKAAPPVASNPLPNSSMINAGFHAARTVLENYSEFDSGLVSDELLTSAVTEVLQAAEAVRPKVVPPVASAAE
jgi:hypothetical protein